MARILAAVLMAMAIGCTGSATVEPDPADGGTTTPACIQSDGRGVLTEPVTVATDTIEYDLRGRKTATGVLADNVIRAGSVRFDLGATPDGEPVSTAALSGASFPLCLTMTEGTDGGSGAALRIDQPDTGFPYESRRGSAVVLGADGDVIFGRFSAEVWTYGDTGIVTSDVVGQFRFRVTQ